MAIPIPGIVLAVMEDAFRSNLRDVRVCAGPRSRAVLDRLRARAAAAGSYIFLRTLEDARDIPLMAHEIAHVLQARNRRGSASPLRELEDEAGSASAQVLAGHSVDVCSARLRGFACTPASESVTRLISYSWNDWSVSAEEAKQVIAALSGDPNPIGTMQALHAAGLLDELFDRVDRVKLAQIIGGRIDEATATAIRPSVIRRMKHKHDFPDNTHLFLFDVSNQLQNRLRPMGLVQAAPAFNTSSLSAVIGKTKTAPFSGAGATGVSPARQPAIPLHHQMAMWKGVDSYLSLYHNPLGDLVAYLAAMSRTERMQQAQVLLQQPIASVVPYSYSSGAPSRAQVMRAAAKIYNLNGALVAAFILAEQRDQSGNEDAKDYQAAISMLQKDTSIGLGQVVISTARNGDLFADLLSQPFRQKLTHNEIALLLTSDEFNIFAAARYLRQTANAGAGHSRATLPFTALEYPNIDFRAYAMNSGFWPEDNIAALGSEYTSYPWDDDVKPYWGDFVRQAYRDVIASGVF